MRERDLRLALGAFCLVWNCGLDDGGCELLELRLDLQEDRQPDRMSLILRPVSVAFVVYAAVKLGCRGLSWVNISVQTGSGPGAVWLRRGGCLVVGCQHPVRLSVTNVPGFKLGHISTRSVAI